MAYKLKLPELRAKKKHQIQVATPEKHAKVLKKRYINLNITEAEF